MNPIRLETELSLGLNDTWIRLAPLGPTWFWITARVGAPAVLISASSLAMAGTSSESHVYGHSSSAAAAPLTQSQAKQKLKAAGYSNVTDLKKDRDGWTARAMKNGEQVAVDIDNNGTVEPEASSGNSMPPATQRGALGDRPTTPGADPSHGGVQPPRAPTVGR